MRSALIIVAIAVSTAAALSPPVGGAGDARRAAASSRRERRQRWWSKQNRGVTPLSGRSPALDPTDADAHSFVDTDETFLPDADAEPLLQCTLERIETQPLPSAPVEGELRLVQITGTSSLGLAVVTLPAAHAGIVYTDEAAYPPSGCLRLGAIGVGDVLPAYVLKARDDGKFDFTFRPVEPVARLHEAAARLLHALIDDASATAGSAATSAAAPDAAATVDLHTNAHAHAGPDADPDAIDSGGGDLPLGDASSPEQIRIVFSGLSKASFKAARGHLLKRRLLQQPLSPRRTRLAAGATWPPHLRRPAEGATVWLTALPDAAAGALGAAAVYELLSDFGEVICIRGFSSSAARRAPEWVCVTMRDEAAVAAVLRGLRGQDQPTAFTDADATARGARLGAGAGAGAGAGGRCRRVFVGNLPDGAGEGLLWDTFSECGYIDTVSMPRAEDGGSRGFGYVVFKQAEAAERALRLGGVSAGGCKLRVELSAEFDDDGFDVYGEHHAWDQRAATLDDADAHVDGDEVIAGADDDEANELGELLATAEIEELLSRREALRSSRAFAEADAARNALWAMGVAVDDDAGEWRCLASGRTGAIRRTRRTPPPPPLPPGLLSDSQVEALLLRRDDLRRRREFRAADEVLDELFDGGVTVDFRRGEWRCLETRRTGSLPRATAAATATATATTRAALSDAEIGELLDEREALRAARDYEAADALRETLWRSGVKVDDRTGGWRCMRTGREGELPPPSRARGNHRRRGAERERRGGRSAGGRGGGWRSKGDTGREPVERMWE